MIHGKVSTYNAHSCRCVECRRAMRDYRLKVKTTGARRVYVESKHGKLSYYTHKGCRCWFCCNAMADYQQKWRQTDRAHEIVP